MNTALSNKNVHQHFDFTGGDAVIDQLYDFTMNLRWEDVPQEVQNRTRNLFLDLIGVLVVATKTPVSRICCDIALEHFAAGPNSSARLPLDGRAVSPTGAAFFMGKALLHGSAHV